MIRPRTPRGVTPTDRAVGQAIRAQRLARRISQTTLAERIGVTFQQVQKYEKGINRVGAGRLQSIADVFGLPITMLFPNQGQAPLSHAGDFMATFAADQYGNRVAKAMTSIRSPALRRSLTEHIETIAKCCVG